MLCFLSLGNRIGIDIVLGDDQVCDLAMARAVIVLGCVVGLLVATVGPRASAVSIVDKEHVVALFGRTCAAFRSR